MSEFTPQYRLCKADLNRIKRWEVERDFPVKNPDDPNGMPDFETKNVKLRFDASNYDAVFALQVDFDTACDVVTAWLEPQWSLRMSREQWDELLTPEFVGKAVQELGELLLSSIPARMRESVQQAAEASVIAYQKAMTAAALKVSNVSGTRQQENADLEQTPTS